MSLIPQVPWTGGIDRSRPTIHSDPNTAYDLRNIVIGSDGIKRIRGGMRSYYNEVDGDPIGFTGATGTDIADFTGVRAIIPYVHGRRKFLAAILNDGMYTKEQAETLKISNSEDLAKVYASLQFGGQLLFTLRQDPYRLNSWNGSGAVQAVDTAPLMKYIRVHYGRIIGAGNPEQPMLWYASAANDASDWVNSTDPDYPDIGGFTGEIPSNRPITGISESHYSGFYFSTTESLHFISGRSPTEFQHKLVSNGLGNFGHRTMLNVGGNILGWNQTGCYVIADTDRTGGVTSLKISTPIEPIFNEYARNNPSEFFSINDFINGLYITFMPGRSTADSSIAICYNYLTQQWTWYEFNQRIHSATMWDYGHRPLMLLGTNNSLIAFLQPGALKDLEDTSYETDFGVTIATHKLQLAPTPDTGMAKGIGVIVTQNQRRVLTIDVMTEGGDRKLHRTYPVQLKLNTSELPSMDHTFVLGTSKFAWNESFENLTSMVGGLGRYGQLSIRTEDAATLGSLELIALYFMGDPIKAV